MIGVLMSNGYSYIMNECYNRISYGKPYDVNFKPYTKVFLEKVISYFEGEEEYEKCKTLIDFIDIKMDHENGYTI